MMKCLNIFLPFTFVILFCSHYASARTVCELSPEIVTFFLNTTSNSIQTSASTGDNIIQFEAKKCPCSRYINDDYCPISNNENVCSVHRWSRDPRLETLCLKQTWLDRISASIYLPNLFLLAIAIIAPFTTTMGKNAKEYALSFCFPCIRKRHIDRIIHREMESITEHIRARAGTQRDDGKIEITVLKLKTKPVNKDFQFTYEDKNCQICMIGLEEGDRIGDLSCFHSFHSDCLKEWIKRKNTCPLCNVEVAKSEVVLMDREDVTIEEEDAVIDDAARDRFDRLTAFYRRRTSRWIRSRRT